jgi:hypothetical protein
MCVTIYGNKSDLVIAVEANEKHGTENVLYQITVCSK